MQLDDFPAADGMAVWLNADEMQQVLDVYAEDVLRRLALSLAGRCGLRVSEIAALCREHVHLANGNGSLHLEGAKGDKTRDTPVPDPLAGPLMTFIQARELEAADPVIGRSTRTLRYWVDEAADELRVATGDERWRHLSPHDLRRSWAMLLIEADVHPLVVMRWGGWERFTYFEEHYLSRLSEGMERRQRAKVDWM